MPTCVKFSGSPANNSLAKPHQIRFSSGARPLAITKSPRWTIMAAPVGIASLCDEKQHSLRENYRFEHTVESKSKTDCISMKTRKDCYDAGFQVCLAAASQDAGIHDSRRIDPCAGNWR